MAQPGLAVGSAVGSAEAAAVFQGQVAEPALVLAVTQTAGCRHASVRPRHLSHCCQGLNRGQDDAMHRVAGNVQLPT